MDELKDKNFNKHNLQNILKSFSSQNNLTFVNLMKALRSSLSGLKEGPSVAEMMEILGKESSLERIARMKRRKQ